MRRTGMIVGITALGMVIGVACGPEAGTAAPTPSDALEATPVVQIVTSTPQAGIETPEPATVDAQEEAFVALLAKKSALIEPAPWLVFTAGFDEGRDDTLWVVRAGESESRQISTDYIWTFDIQTQAADGSTRVAYVSASEPNASEMGLTLKTVTLPGGEIETITPLTSAETAFTGQDPNDENSNFWQVSNIASAITFPGSAAWSPDGKWLAFVGAMNGPSADVYSYEVATGQIRQLTSGSDHAYQLLWSPDSRWIVHIAQESFARSGGVFEAASGVCAAAPDSSAVNTLEGPRASEFLGWVDVDTLMIEGGPRMGPGRDLRQINIATARIIDLEPACYSGFAYSIPYDEYLVDVDDYILTDCPFISGWSPGLYLVKDRARIPIEGLDAFEYRWSDVWGVFFATQRSYNTPIAISPDGTVLPDFADKISSERVSATESGDALAWTDNGALVIATGPDYHPVRISSSAFGNIKSMTWSQ